MGSGTLEKMEGIRRFLEPGWRADEVEWAEEGERVEEAGEAELAEEGERVEEAEQAELAEEGEKAEEAEQADFGCGKARLDGRP